ncbi:uncharacterized protein LOC21402761 isoform X2 [Morus notabilis]|uniref:uncharacterized protein LOC21402761 isoform X2 n=1 Tax=Morus notabilis TaxID=981085 RepID=UPI000CED137C|nr:uncharacterized protein LOC21402761 isoform X2 [Morus notabilis]
MTMACRVAPFRFPSTASQTHFLFSTLHATRLSLSANSTATTQPQLSRLGPIFMSQPAADSSAVPSSQDGAEKADGSDVLVQYVVLRRDLIDTWPLGSVVTQGCHASVAAVWLSREDPHTVQYCSPDNIDSMHKDLILDSLF